MHALFYVSRQRRICENKLFAGDERLEEFSTLLKQTRQVASESETRYDEVGYINSHYLIVHTHGLDNIQQLLKTVDFFGGIDFNTIIM